MADIFSYRGERVAIVGCFSGTDEACADGIATASCSSTRHVSRHVPWEAPGDTNDADGAEAHWRLHVANANRWWVPPEYRERVIDVLG